MPTIPSPIPAALDPAAPGFDTGLPSASQFSLYDVALNGTGFMYANTVDNPIARETAQYEKQRIDQAETPGEQTLTNWWIKSQDSFHGGAGQVNLEPPDNNPLGHIRYSLSKNLDPSIPGRLSRLPDMFSVSTEDVVQMIGWYDNTTLTPHDDIVILTTAGDVKLLANIDTIPVVVDFSDPSIADIVSLACDGRYVYASTVDDIFILDPSTPAAVPATVASYPATATNVVLGWVKSRLLAAADSDIYTVDVSTTGVVLGASELLYTHPSNGWAWRCFGESPTAALVAGDAGSFSEIVQFSLQEVAGAPVLQVQGTIGGTPVGERILSLRNVGGSFLGVGTTRGIRVGQYDNYYGFLNLGPLLLSPLEPTIPCVDIITRDRFMYAVGLDYDEAGLICVDTGVPTDQAGRYAWHPHLVTDDSANTTAATCGAVLPVTSRLAFAVPGVGVFVEGTGAGTARESWLRTSRIRYGTTEPKLFKLGSLRGDVANASTATVRVAGTTPAGTFALATLGFTDTPPDFALPDGLSEWLQLKFTVTGNDAVLTGWAVKALPGTKRQVRVKLVLAIFDAETTRSGQQTRDHLRARDRRDVLEDLAAAGDVILLQEFTPSGTQASLVVVESVSFTQIGRPSKTSDVGGTASVILRTIT